MSVIQRSIQVNWQLRVFFTENVFAPANPVLKDALADTAPRKVLVVLEDSLALAQPNLSLQIGNYFAAQADNLQLLAPPIRIEGGERAKNSDEFVAEIHSQIDHHHIDRHSYLIAVGGSMSPVLPPRPHTAAYATSAFRRQLCRRRIQVSV